MIPFKKMNMTTNLIKLFSVGYPAKEGSFTKLIDKYSDYIHDIFSSPIGSDKYHSRRGLYKLTSEYYSNEFYNNILHAIKSGIKFNLCLNTAGLSAEDIVQAINNTKKYIDITYVTTLKKYGSIVKEILPYVKLIYSYNNGLKGIDDLSGNYFTILVIGGAHIRNFELIKKAKHGGFAVKLLLNNGCAHNCLNICTGNCKQLMLENINRYGLTYMYALQSIMPFELHEYYLNSGIDLFKISSRKAKVDDAIEILQSYIANENDNRYMLWGRLAWLHNQGTINYQNVIKAKEKIWKIKHIGEQEMSSKHM